LGFEEQKGTRMSVWVGNLFWPDLARNDKGHTKGGGQTGGQIEPDEEKIVGMGRKARRLQELQ